MKSSTLAALAAVQLGALIWLWTVMAQPGSQTLASIGAGASAWFFVQLMLAAVRADARERLAEELRRIQDGDRR